MNIPSPAGKVSPSSWPARLAGFGVLLLNAALLVMGFLLFWKSGQALAHSFSLPQFYWMASFWMGLAGLSIGVVCVYEAAFPWLTSVEEDAVWHETLKPGKAEKPWALIKQWCEEAGVPNPDSIEMNWEPNAGTDLKALRQGRLRLRIGLPLWLGMETRMLRVVVMHELGHFHQQKRLHPVLRHQELGLRIQRGAADGHHPFWALMSKLWGAVRQLAKPWLHSLEADADAFAISKSSPEWIAVTMLRLKSLEQSTAQTFRTVQSSLVTGVLPKNLVALYRQETQSLLHPLSASLERRAYSTQESLTHPSLRQRLQRSGHRGLEDIKLTDEVAWIPEKAYAKELTESFYRHELGPTQKDLGRVSVNDARCQLTRSQDALSALEHYFHSLVKDVAPIRPVPSQASQDGDWLGSMNARARLPLLRRTLLLNRSAWLAKREEWIAANEECRLLASGKAAPARLGDDPQKSLQEVLMKREAAAAELRNATEQFSQRLNFGLLLLESPDVAKQWPEAKLWVKVASALREDLPLMSRLLGFLEEVSFDVARLEGLKEMPSGRRRVCEGDARRQIWQAMAKAIAAFDRRDLADRTARQQFAEIFERLGTMDAETIVERMEALYSRLSQSYLQGLGDLAYAAGKAELVAGIKPWD